MELHHFHSTCQRLAHLRQQQEVRRSGEQVPSRTPRAIDLDLDCPEQFRGALHFVEDNRVRQGGNEGGWIRVSGGEDGLLVEAYICAFSRQASRKRGLAALA